jgi:glutaredoxin
MKDKFILFYMNGCYYCDLFKNTWTELKQNTNYDFIEYESNELQNSNDAKEIGINTITGFPSIYCNVNQKYYKYEGNRTKEDLIKFIESKKNNSNNSNNLNNNSINNDIKFYYFYMNNCKYCNQFNSLWNNIKSKYQSYECDKSHLNESTTAQKIQSTLNLKITSFPSIFIKINDKYYKYEGKRTMEKILEYIEKIINNKVQKGGKVNYRYKYKKYKEMYYDLLDKYNKLI